MYRRAWLHGLSKTFYLVPKTSPLSLDLSSSGKWCTGLVFVKSCPSVETDYQDSLAGTCQINALNPASVSPYATGLRRDSLASPSRQALLRR